MVQEANVEGSVVNHQLGARHESQKVLHDVIEARLVGQEFVGDAVHLDRAGIDLPVGLQILMVVIAGEAAVDQLHAADFDDAVPLGGLQAGGFSIEDDLSHGSLE